MSGYRCVNYYELCRLCTNTTGTRTHIFSDEGRKKDLIGKIAVCLPVVVSFFGFFALVASIIHFYTLCRLMNKINYQKFCVEHV